MRGLSITVMITIELPEARGAAARARQFHHHYFGAPFKHTHAEAAGTRIFGIFSACHAPIARSWGHFDDEGTRCENSGVKGVIERIYFQVDWSRDTIEEPTFRY